MSRLVVWWVVLVAAFAFPKWGTYRPGNLFTLLSSETGESLQFGLAEAAPSPQPKQFDEEDLRTEDSEVQSSRYLLHDGHSLFRKSIQLKNSDEIEVFGSSQAHSAELLFSLRPRNNNTYYFLKVAPQTVEVSRIKMTHATDVKCTTKKVDKEELRALLAQVVYNQQTEEGKNTLITCTGPSSSFNISFTFDSEPLLSSNWQAREKSFEDKLSVFMGKHELAEANRDIVRHGLSTTLSHISLWEGFVGHIFGFRNEQGAFDVKYSMLLIDVLGDFDFQLAHTLMNNTIEYLQDKIIYGEESLDQLPCPEHLQALMKFDNDKALRVVNGLVFRAFFQRVNKVIGKEEDYTASKRIHPILLTMLQARWHSRFGYLAATSIYTESFLDDLYLNGQEQSQDLSLSKFAWLLKAVKVLKHLNLASNSPLSLVEIDSLADLMTRYLADQCTDKQSNIMRSINMVGRNRYYTKYRSIQSMIPHMYQLYSKYEASYVAGVQLLRNLTSQLGIQSMEIDPKKKFKEDQYKFRGNIVPYFNYKIWKMLQRDERVNKAQIVEKYKGSPNYKGPDETVKTIKQMLQQVRAYEGHFQDLLKDTLSSKVIADWKKSNRLYGWWSPTGKSFQPDSHLVLLNTLFLQ